MKTYSITIASAVVILSATTAFSAIRPTVLGMPKPQANSAERQPPKYPNPINLRVLPRNLTGDQVHEIMLNWVGELGAGCKTCHTVDKNSVGPNGKPQLNFADDSKEEKKTARLMYKMMEEINTNYVSKVPNSGEPVSCGTCHRGHLGPEPFVPRVTSEGF